MAIAGEELVLKGLQARLNKLTFFLFSVYSSSHTIWRPFPKKELVIQLLQMQKTRHALLLGAQEAAGPEPTPSHVGFLCPLKPGIPRALPKARVSLPQDTSQHSPLQPLIPHPPACPCLQGWWNSVHYHNPTPLLREMEGTRPMSSTISSAPDTTTTKTHPAKHTFSS